MQNAKIKIVFSIAIVVIIIGTILFSVREKEKTIQEKEGKKTEIAQVEKEKFERAMTSLTESEKTSGIQEKEWKRQVEEDDISFLKRPITFPENLSLQKRVKKSIEAMEQAFKDEPVGAEWECLPYIEYLISLGSKVIPEILSIVKDKNVNTDVRDLLVFEVIGAIHKEKEALEGELLEKTGDTLLEIALDTQEDRNLRISCVDTLWVIGAKNTAKGIYTLLRSEDYGIRMRAVLALGKLKADFAADALIDLFRQTKGDDQLFVAYNLVDIEGEDCVPLIMEAYKKGNSLLAYPLVHSGNKEAIELIIEDFQESPSVGLITALEEGVKKGVVSKERMVSILIPILKHSDSYLVYWAAKILGNIGDEEVIPYLEEILKAPPSAGVREKCIEAIAEIREREDSNK